MSHAHDDSPHPLVGRRAIFDARLVVVGYELGHAGQGRGRFGVLADPLASTLRALAEVNLSPEAGGGPASLFLHYPVPPLGDLGLPLPYPKGVALEVFEADVLGAELAEALARIKAQGYALAVDGYLGRPGGEDLCRLADVIAVDLDGLDLPRCAALVDEARGYGARFWAKNVQDPDGFGMARKAGFELFSGPFFKEMKILARQELSSHEAARLNILRLIEAPEPDTAALVGAIESDVSVSLRLLTLVNSPTFGVARKVSSIGQAVTMVGTGPLRQWLRLVVLADLAPPAKTRELLFASLQRAVFLDALSRQAGGRQDVSGRAFLLGLLSLLESLLELPMSVALHGLPLDEDILAALCRREGPCLPWLELVEFLEEFSFEEALGRMRALSLRPEDVEAAYLSSIARANQLMAALGASPRA